MNGQNSKNLSTEPYKGVRDFYPEDMFVLKYIFSVMRKTAESFGYVEYGASILEPTELYKAKSGEEIINEQTYSFKDRGDRDVTLRPEMTPTVTRMVAARKRQLQFPLRWFSIPNLFRYEKPQRGRLREHFQLNVDIFGVETLDAEVEVISLAYQIMMNFGAESQSFKIKISSRKILNYLLEEVYALPPEDAYAAMKLIDRKNKITPAEYKEKAKEIFKTKTESFLKFLEAKTITEFTEIAAVEASSKILGASDVAEVIHRLNLLGIQNVEFDPTLARGFDYYTGIVFEVNDTSPENPRALFGGGRFDDLLSVFGSDKVPAVGFGMGDVGIRDFLETYNILPNFQSKVEVAICPLKPEFVTVAEVMAQNLRDLGLNVVVDLSNRKIGQMFDNAAKISIPFAIAIGEDEVKERTYKLRDLATREEKTFSLEKDIASHVQKTLKK